MDEKGHQTHTTSVYIDMNKRPIRANAGDAIYFVKWIDNILVNLAPGKPWNCFFTHDLGVVKDRYIKSKEKYLKITNEAKKCI